jgi:hypothetical protein
MIAGEREDYWAKVWRSFFKGSNSKIKFDFEEGQHVQEHVRLVHSIHSIDVRPPALTHLFQ